MDAAYYITTLEEMSPKSDKPQVASYAIIDLAIAHDFLKQLYNVMANETVAWWSLFEGSEWQPSWSSGPILVDLRNSYSLTQQLTEDMEARPQGVLIHTSLEPTNLRDRCQKWLLGSESSRLLRFHEPRMLGPLLCVMGDAQRHQFVPPGEQWTWHDGGVWRTHIAAVTDNAVLNEEPLSPVSEDQLRQASHYRLAAQAQDFASYYESNLISHKDPSVWVLDRLLEAHRAGMTKVSDQERWLRLAIVHGDDFPEIREYREILKQEQWSASERLTAMESIRKSDYVATA
ncbi:DUF4123 domain-containing protein [uncultured Marinobacter sp.]|nr:DUF4123 domain-containing protein [uncultured Marinobacter sp.]